MCTLYVLRNFTLSCGVYLNVSLHTECYTYSVFEYIKLISFDPDVYTWLLNEIRALLVPVEVLGWRGI